MQGTLRSSEAICRPVDEAPKLTRPGDQTELIPRPSSVASPRHSTEGAKVARHEYVLGRSGRFIPAKLESRVVPYGVHLLSQPNRTATSRVRDGFVSRLAGVPNVRGEA